MPPMQPSGHHSSMGMHEQQQPSKSGQWVPSGGNNMMPSHMMSNSNSVHNINQMGHSQPNMDMTDYNLGNMMQQSVNMNGMSQSNLVAQMG